MGRRLALAAVLCALTVNPAHAAVRQAENLLGPGQSGFVSPTGVLSGTGSPHLYDQAPLYEAFRWKPFGFDQPPAGSEQPRAGVTIARDAFGVPSVRASTMEDAWWGVGYAIAQDRMFQIEAFSRATTGRLAEVLGRSALGDDLIARRDYYTAPELERLLAAAPPALQARSAAYRSGVNAWTAKVRGDLSQLPGEFVGTGLQPSELTAVEQAAIGVFLARTVPSGDGEELRNLRALRAIGAKNFDRLMPLRQPREVYTVPAAEASFPNQPGRTRAVERAAFKRTLAASAAWELPSDRAQARARARVQPGLPGAVGGSYMFAARAPDGRAVLFNGPQLGFSAPELFVEFEVHYPGVDLRGVSAAGVPLVGIGHNGKIAWGLTSGLSDEDDLYAEKLSEDGGESYAFRGEQRKMECRNERFAYAKRLNAVIGGELPEQGSVTERICRTVHGPVQLRAGHTAYARKYAIWGRELETIAGIGALNEASTVQDVDRALRDVTWNENVIAIDSRGQIGYWHPGLHQLRPRRFDERLPYPGTGEAEWRGLRDRAQDPHVINPKQGWLANWNNLPAKGWTTGDGEATERLAGPYHRAAYLQRLVAAWAKNPTFAGAQAVVTATGTHAQQRPLADTRLRRALRGATGHAEQVLRALVEWDGSYERTDAAGTVEPGVAVWESLKQRLAARMLDRLGGTGGRELAGGTGSSHMFDISNGEARALRVSKPGELRAAAEEAFAQLAERFATEDVTRWREPRRMYEQQIQGAMSPPPLQFYDRGTYEQFVELGP